MAFEQLMAEAAQKQEKKKDKETPADKKREKEKEKEKEKDHANHHHPHNPFAATKPHEEMSDAEAKGKAHVAGQDPNGTS